MLQGGKQAGKPVSAKVGSPLGPNGQQAKGAGRIDMGKAGQHRLPGGAGGSRQEEADGRVVLRPLCRQVSPRAPDELLLLECS